MSTVSSFNGVSYTVPAQGEEDWAGSTKVDGLLISLAANALAKSGGTFPLTADVDFGGSFGLKSLYFASRTSNPATAGVFRLANNEGIYWRDTANGTNGSLVFDAQNQWTFTQNKTGTSSHLLVTQGNDGAGDHAVIEAATGGTTGSPYALFLLRIGGGGGTQWSLFADSGASNLFSICNGTTPGMNAFLSITTAGAVAIHGTGTNNNAAAGYVGEYVSATNGGSFTAFPASTTWGDALSISLTAGDWDVSAFVSAALIGSTMTYFDMGISTTSGNSSTGLVEGDSQAEGIPPTSNNDSPATIPAFRMSLASTTTVYLKVRAGYSAGTPKYAGRISARRIR